MKPAPFEYQDPRAVAEVVSLLARHGDDAKVLAGGQSLVPMLNLRLARPAVVVDVNRVAGLDTLTEADGTARVGALVRQRAFEAWARARFPLAAAALRLVGHLAIRVRGTVAGSLVHADPAAELPALLRCVDGMILAEGPGGQREIAAAAFFRGPLLTALAPDELVVETRWPLPAAGSGWGFHEVARRHGDFALAGAAAVVELAAGRVRRVRLALFGVGTTPVRASAAEAGLAGQAPTAPRLEETGRLAAADLAPDADLHAPASYRRRVAATLATRALADAVARAEGRAPAGAAP